MTRAADESTNSAGPPASARGLLACLLLAPFCFALYWSHLKYLWVDELLEFYSDTRPSGLAVLNGQLHHPFSLEPPLFHLLLHYSWRLLPQHPALAMRLPSVLLFALLQWCLFRVVWRLTRTTGAALLAAALPMCVSTQMFAPEGRVYELMACAFAVALLAYCTALQSAGRQRRWALCALALSLSVGVLSHYYGIFLPLPFVLAETVRSVRHRKLEGRFAIAVLLPVAMVTANVPFLPALKPVQAHYFDVGQAAWDRIPFTYAWLLAQNDMYRGDLHSTIVSNTACVVAFGALPIALAVLVARRKRVGLRLPDAPERAAMLLVLAATMLVPVAAVALAHRVTHAYWPRYTIETVVAAVAVLSLAAAPLLRRRTTTAVALLLVVAIASDTLLVHSSRDRQIQRSENATLGSVSPDLVRAEATESDPHLYVEQVYLYLELSMYAPPEQRSRLVEFNATERSARWNVHSPVAAFAENMHASTTLPYLPYADLRKLPGPHLLLVTKEPDEEWVAPELDEPGRVLSAEPVGRAFGAYLYRVTFPATP